MSRNPIFLGEPGGFNADGARKQKSSDGEWTLSEYGFPEASRSRIQHYRRYNVEVRVTYDKSGNPRVVVAGIVGGQVRGSTDDRGVWSYELTTKAGPFTLREAIEEAAAFITVALREDSFWPDGLPWPTQASDA
jgi:hypothetical protein